MRSAEERLIWCWVGKGEGSVKLKSGLLHTLPDCALKTKIPFPTL